LEAVAVMQRLEAEAEARGDERAADEARRELMWVIDGAAGAKLVVPEGEQLSLF
jgi:hypothetical protein